MHRVPESTMDKPPLDSVEVIHPVTSGKLDDTISKIMAQPVSQTKTGLFGKTKPDLPLLKVTQDPNQFQPRTPHTRTSWNPLWLALPILLLSGGAWYLMAQHDDQPNLTSTTASVSKPTPNPISSTTVPAVASITPKASAPSTETQASQPLDITTATPASEVTAVATTVTILKPDDILKAELPNDAAIAKEELDRLGEQSYQLQEQEQIMQEQLTMMNELSSKKEQRIKLLEQQVAQLEQQKATQNAGQNPAKPQ